MYVDEIRAYTPQNEQEAADQRLILEYIRLFPDNILTRDNEIAHLSSSGFVVNADGTRVLMAHHNIYRVWAWTGGHADGEGDLLSVALREAREETGVEHIRPLSPAIASLDILPVWGHVKRGKWVPSHQHLNVSYLLVADESDAPDPGGGEQPGGLASGGAPAGVHQRVADGRRVRQAVGPGEGAAAERISGLRGRALLKILGQCDTVRMPSVPAHFCLLQAKDNNN